MVNQLPVACFLFAFMAQTLASPVASSIRDVIDDHAHMSASVIEGIVIGIVVLISIPLLWCAYRMCHPTRAKREPLFIPRSPIYATNPTPNHAHNSEIHPSRYITRPHKAHTKLNAPMYHA